MDANAFRYRNTPYAYGVLNREAFMEVLLPEIALTHGGHVIHICVSKLTITISDNGLWPCRPQAIIWINAGMLLMDP